MSPEARATASLAIAERALAEIGAARVVALYAAKGSEVETIEIDRRLRARGITVAYPLVRDDRKQLAFCAVSPDELVAGHFGIREPVTSGPEIALASIDLMFVPGIAFDRRGARVGWGRGHYDATIAAAPHARRIGLAFECQVIDHVPSEPHDALLHAIVTEVAVHAGAP